MTTSFFFEQRMERGRRFLPPDGQDLSKGYRLLVRDDGQGFQRRHGQFCSRLGLQISTHMFVMLWPGCHAKAARDFANPHAAPAGIKLLRQSLERRFDLVVALIREYLLQLLRAYRIIGSINNSFKYGLEFFDFHRPYAVSPADLLLVIWISSNAFS